MEDLGLVGDLAVLLVAALVGGRWRTPYACRCSSATWRRVSGPTSPTASWRTGACGEEMTGTVQQRSL